MKRRPTFHARPAPHGGKPLDALMMPAVREAVLTAGAMPPTASFLARRDAKSGAKFQRPTLTHFLGERVDQSFFDEARRLVRAARADAVVLAFLGFAAKQPDEAMRSCVVFSYQHRNGRSDYLAVITRVDAQNPNSPVASLGEFMPNAIPWIPDIL